MKKALPNISIGYIFVIFVASFLMGDWIHGMVSGLMLVFMYVFRKILHPYLYIFIPITVTLYFLGSLGMYNHWYFFDKPVHLVTSFTVTFCVANLILNYFKHKLSRFTFISIVFIIGIAIGVGWEVFEYLASFFIEHNLIRGWFDTITDVIFDAFGALIGSVYAYSVLKPKVTDA